MIIKVFFENQVTKKEVKRTIVFWNVQDSSFMMSVFDLFFLHEN